MLRRRFYLPLWLELPLRAAASALYRLRSRGREAIPAEGGVVLVANHLSYVDPILLQLASPRRLRFVGWRGPKPPWYFDLVFRLAGVIPISDEAPLSGMRAAAAALARGEVVCLFPEGGISRTGQLMPIRRGYEILARRARAPVVPAAIDGVWGSVFSFAEQRFLWKSPRLMPTPVSIAFGPPLPPEEAGPDSLRRALLELGAEAFTDRPILRRHLGREVIRALAKNPGRVAAVDRTGERRALKAAQLIAAGAVLARWLRRAVPERRVGIVLPPGAGAMVANLGVICAGKIPVNLNFTSSPAALRAALRMGEIGAVISADAMRERLPHFPWPERTHDLRGAIAQAGGKRALLPWIAAAWLLPNQWVADLLRLPRRGGEEEAVLLFTSGSAGDPKGVVLTHRNLLANCEQFSSLSILPQRYRLLGCLPVFHSFGCTVTLWYPLLRRCGLVTVPSPLETRRMVEAIAAERVHVLIAAPTFLRPLLKKAEPAELRSLELVVAGAEALPDDLHRRFREVFGIEILEGYGLTEASPVVSVNQPLPASARASGQVGKKAGTVGRLLPGLAARICDPETGRPVASSGTGILALKGANIFPGYLGQGSAAIDAGGWFATGDLASFDEEGFLRIAGRLSRFSKIGGEMVPHGVIERELAMALKFDEAEEPAIAVTCVPDAQKGEALVVLAAIALGHEEVREMLQAAGLPALWIPKIVIRVEKIPLLGTGKLDLGACRRLASPPAATARPEPRPPT